MQVLEVRHKVSLLIWILILKGKFIEDLSQTIKRLAPSSETNTASGQTGQVMNRKSMSVTFVKAQANLIANEVCKK